jgi:hypothetical protein
VGPADAGRADPEKAEGEADRVDPADVPEPAGALPGGPVRLAGPEEAPGAAAEPRTEARPLAAPLTGAALTGAALTGAALTGAALTGAALTGAALTGVDSGPAAAADGAAQSAPGAGGGGSSYPSSPVSAAGALDGVRAACSFSPALSGVACLSIWVLPTADIPRRRWSPVVGC